MDCFLHLVRDGAFTVLETPELTALKVAQGYHSAVAHVVTVNMALGRQPRIALNGSVMEGWILTMDLVSQEC